LGLLVQRVTIDNMDVSAAEIAEIPAGNVRVPQAQLVALWRTAEGFHGRGAMYRLVDSQLECRPGWVEAVVTMLNWVWRRYGSPPLELH
jgi:hypothetical protein